MNSGSSFDGMHQYWFLWGLISFFLEPWRWHLSRQARLARPWTCRQAASVSRNVSAIVGDFDGCDSLERIEVDPNNKNYVSVSGVLYSKDMRKIRCYPSAHPDETFTIPSTVTDLRIGLFTNCKLLKELHIPNYADLAENIIKKCPALTAIHIHIKDIKGAPIDKNAFHGVYTSLCTLYVPKGCAEDYRKHPAFAAFAHIQEEDGVLFSKDGTELMKMPRKVQVQDYVIPDGVKKIHDHAFKGCGKLQTITIPQSVSEIGHSIFDGCKGITSLKLLCALSDLYWYTFTELDKKKCKVYVPEMSFRYGFRGSAIENFDVYSLKELEAGDDPDSEVIVEVSVDEKGYALKLGKKTKITGDFHLEDIETISPRIYDYLDVSEATFGSQMEEWSQFLGMSHSGPVYGNSGTREVDILLRFISSVKVATLVLPDDVQRRHVNAAKNNAYIKQLIVRDSCKLFSYVDGRLMNKKKTLTVFER